MGRIVIRLGGLIDILVPLPNITEWLPVRIIVKTAMYALVAVMAAVSGYLALWFILIALKWLLEYIQIAVNRLLDLFERE